ncbi:uncharacterized protein [Typha latifolia]|uniref:uncharacterized protein n=1 Tax=Typha latifolia TaxID=4733 RepID=UPI003C2B0377
MPPSSTPISPSGSTKIGDWREPNCENTTGNVSSGSGRSGASEKGEERRELRDTQLGTGQEELEGEGNEGVRREFFDGFSSRRNLALRISWVPHRGIGSKEAEEASGFDWGWEEGRDGTNNSDKAALLVFKEGIYNSMNALSNWNETTHVCEWEGVSCENGRVYKLALSCISLQGKISPFLSNLSCLRYLDLSENSLQGPIPVDLGLLSSLTALILYDNRLQYEIPESLGMLKDLVYLNLARNHLRGSLPMSLFYNCTMLFGVDLSNNSLYGSIPPHIGSHLLYMQDLLLPFNHLMGSIPASLTDIRMIDLEGNSLTGPLPSDIVVHMPQLQYLYLSYNNLSSDGEYSSLTHFFSSISNLTHLQGLGLAANGLKGKLPSTIGLLHVNLSQVFLEENSIYGAIPSNISNLSNLVTLSLGGNLLSGAIPSELIHLPKLERMWIPNNFLEGEIPSPDNSTNLGLLDLSWNKISGHIPELLSNLNQLRYLQLSGNLLTGSIPSSIGSMKLESLDLSHNQLTGAIQTERTTLRTTIRFFDLSDNSLEGSLPLELSKMDHVQTIDLSANNFSGLIPPSIGSCIEVELLNLSHNSLRGPLPGTLGNLRNLQKLDVSSNLLSGEVPDSLQKCTNLQMLNLSFNNFSGPLPARGIFPSLTYESLDGNEFCGVEGFPTCRIKHKSILHSHKSLVLLICIVSVLLFLLTVGCVIRLIKSAANQSIDGGSRMDELNLVRSHQRITHRELSEATRGFNHNNLIGSGGFGSIYRGELSDGSLVAIKVLKLQSGNSTRTFNRECQVLKRIRHRNLMKIITTCVLPDFKALVLPYMANGSLESHLHEGSTFLSLMQRVNICSDVAEGMAYLHHHSPFQVIHCDLKPSNILLSDDMAAMVSDFGIARLITTVAEGNANEDATSSTGNLLCGSLGYVAPEYGYGSSASAKGDVYSFGIVVLEMLTRRRPTDDMFKDSQSLAKWVKNKYHSQLEKIIDPDLMTDLLEKKPEIKAMWKVVILDLLELGILCTQEAPSNRPYMIDAADDLNKMKEYLTGDGNTTAAFTSSHGI